MTSVALAQIGQCSLILSVYSGVHNVGSRLAIIPFLFVILPECLSPVAVESGHFYRTSAYIAWQTCALIASQYGCRCVTYFMKAGWRMGPDTIEAGKIG